MNVFPVGEKAQSIYFSEDIGLTEVKVDIVILLKGNWLSARNNIAALMGIKAGKYN